MIVEDNGVSLKRLDSEWAHVRPDLMGEALPHVTAVVDAVLAAPVGVADGLSVWSDGDGVRWSVTVHGSGPLPDGWSPGEVVLVPHSR